MLILYGLIAGLFSLVGGLLLVWRADWAKRIMIPLLAFAAGSFMGVSFLDLLPEAVEAVEEPHYIFIAALVGLFVFLALESLLTKYLHKPTAIGEHGHSEHTEAISWLVIIGDSLHNLLDGVVIALIYIANPALGLPTAFAIAAHEVPQEIGDFTILLDRGWSRGKVIAVNVASSLLNLVGIGIGYFGGKILEGYLPYLLAGVAGIFIYLACCNLIPEVQDRAKHRYTYSILTSFLVGLVLTGYLAFLAH
jgi:zinc and cadmium transporter